jgi:hypothetical protein
MAAGQQTDENAVHDALLADDNFRDLIAYLVQFCDCRTSGCFDWHEFDFI